MKPPGDWLALSGTSVVARGVTAVSSPPPQAASTVAAKSEATRIFFMLPSSLRARQRRAEVREGRQQRTVGLDLRAGLVDTVVQPEHCGAQRSRARLACGAELVRVGVAV